MCQQPAAVREFQPFPRAGLGLLRVLWAFLAEATDEQVRAELLRAVHWECGEPPLDQLRELISRQLVSRAQRVTQANVREIEGLVDPRLARVLYIAIQKADRQLSSVELDRLIQDRTQTSIPNVVLRGLLGAQAGGATVIVSDIPSDAPARPLPAPLAPRTRLVDEMARRLATAGNSGRFRRWQINAGTFDGTQAWRTLADH